MSKEKQPLPPGFEYPICTRCGSSVPMHFPQPPIPINTTAKITKKKEKTEPEPE